MRMYRQENVWDAALNRIRWLYDEFDNVVVSMSGGKDSTIIYELAKIVAAEKDRLPVTVMWLDQECEFAGTVEYMRNVFYSPNVNPRWYQIPFQLFNATSKDDPWLHVWGPEDEDIWVREQDPISVKENIYGTERFRDLLDRITATEYEGQRVVALTGVRGEESRLRMASSTGLPTYKWATWGAKNKQAKRGTEAYSMHPIYDWGWLDVWKAILDNGWAYNSHYDAMYRYGIPVNKMRVSNYHHETAVHALFYLQEIEPETYQRATQRIGGLDTAGKMGTDDYFIRELPFMFKDWKEYRDYLMVNLIEKDLQPKFEAKFAQMDDYWERGKFTRLDATYESMLRTQVQSVLTNDWEFVKVASWEMRNGVPVKMMKAKAEA